MISVSKVTDAIVARLQNIFRLHQNHNRKKPKKSVNAFKKANLHRKNSG